VDALSPLALGGSRPLVPLLSQTTHCHGAVSAQRVRSEYHRSPPRTRSSDRVNTRTGGDRRERGQVHRLIRHTAGRTSVVDNRPNQATIGMVISRRTVAYRAANRLSATRSHFQAHSFNSSSSFLEQRPPRPYRFHFKRDRRTHGQTIRFSPGRSLRTLR